VGNRDVHLGDFDPDPNAASVSFFFSAGVTFFGGGVFDPL
jgi:hypothetical protein